MAEQWKVVFCLEPITKNYGSNFMTNTDKTSYIVELVGHPAIKLQLNTCVLKFNKDDPMVMLEKYVHLIGHIHASEPDLLPLCDAIAGVFGQHSNAIDPKVLFLSKRLRLKMNRI